MTRDLSKQAPNILQSLPRSLSLIHRLPDLGIHTQAGKFLLLVLQLQHLLLEAVTYDITRGLDWSLLPQSVYAIHGLCFCSRVVLGFHDVDFVRSREIQAETTGGDGHEDNVDAGIIAEGVEGGTAGGAGHTAIETRVADAVFLECELDEVQVDGPAGEDDALDGRLGGVPKGFFLGG